MVLAKLDILSGLEKHGTYGRPINSHRLLQGPAKVLEILSNRKIYDFVDKFGSRQAS